MTYAEREYQRELDHLVCEDWRHGARDVMPVLPCGGGKTVIFSNIIAREKAASVLIAHRNHLVGQASMTLARQGVRHRVLGSLATQRTCIALHMADLGRHFVDPTAPAAVAGIDTLIKMDTRDPWFTQVKLVITDEGHHLLAGNKWGRGRAMFPEARGAAFTATGMRPDGKGLGRATDGLADSMVQVIGMRDLIKAGWLADYRIYAPPNNLDLSSVSIGASGELNQEGAARAVHKASITGDVVGHYLAHSQGKLGATFAVDVSAAQELTAAYRAAGVPAELITADTPDALRASIFRRFKARQVMQLVSVDILGEGTDVPNMEVISMARPTASWVTFVQQFCRPLRPFGDKVGVIHDHVGNVERHARTRGLPDTPQDYNLDRRERTGKSKPTDAVPVRSCPQCVAVYERVLDCCPFCGHAPEPAGRSTPALVEGVLAELDGEVLRALRREVERVDGPAPNLSSLGDIAQRGAANQHRARQVAQAGLRSVLALWGGWQTSMGRSDTEAQRRFWTRYGLDALTAMALGTRDATELQERIQAELDAAGVVAA
jgi:superfamily II DNA or RNA helicase